MIAKLTLAKVVTALIGVNALSLLASIGAHLDAWAPVANTALLIVLAMLAHANARKIDDTHQSVHSTAQVALTAATAAAEAERVAKSIGSTLRAGDAQPPTREIPDAPPEEPPHAR